MLFSWYLLVHSWHMGSCRHMAVHTISVYLYRHLLTQFKKTAFAESTRNLMLTSPGCSDGSMLFSAPAALGDAHRTVKNTCKGGCAFLAGVPIFSFSKQLLKGSPGQDTNLPPWAGPLRRD